MAPAGCFYSAASPEDAPPAGEVPVYHVHGLLPADRNEPPRGDIIFSEEDYHRVYHDPYHWSNTCQSDLFRSSATLFIGLSFSDPNLRRILDLLSRPTQPMRVAVVRCSLKPDAHGLVRVATTGFTEEIMGELSVHVFWVADYEKEIPLLLRSIASSDPRGYYVRGLLRESEAEEVTCG